MDAAAGEGGERERSWYLSKEEIERGSPSRRDGVGAAKEAHLRATYCCFIREVGLRLQLPQITIATGIVLCHRFYLHQSHAKNEWQTVATACIFLASKIEDTPCPLQRVVIMAHETMYKKNPVAACRINQKGILEKRKALILVGEALLLSTIRYDFNIQHPYEPLKAALKNLGISQKEVKQAAISLINDTLRTTLVIQFKPHYIAAGSLSLAAKFHNVRLPTEKGQVWWHQFDIAPKLLEAAIQQMKELFLKRNPLSTSPAIQPTPADETLVEKKQILSTTTAIRPIPAQAPVEKQQTISMTSAIRPVPAQTTVVKQEIIIKTPAIRPIPAQTLVEKQQTTSTLSAIRPVPAQTPVVKQEIISTTPAIRPVPAQALVEKHQTTSTTSAIRPVPAQILVVKQEIISTSPAIRPVPAQALVEKQQTTSMTSAIRPVPAQTPVVKQEIIITTPAIRPIAQTLVEKQQTTSMTSAIRPVPAQTPVVKQEIIITTPAVRPTRAQPLVEKQQIISFPKPVLKYTYSRRGLKRPAPAPIPSPTLVEKQQIISRVGPVLGQEHFTRGGINRPTTATTPTPAPLKKQKIRSTAESVLGHTQSSAGGTMPTRAPARARTPVRKQQIIPERRPATAPIPARARTPVRKQQIISTQIPVLRHSQPSIGGERRSTTNTDRSLVKKQQIISTPDSVPRHTTPSVRDERKLTTAPSPARARTPVRNQQIISTQVTVLRHSHPSGGGERSAPAPARSPVRKDRIISTPDSVLRHTNPSAGVERKLTTAPSPVRARTPEWKQQIVSTQASVLRHTHTSAGGERKSATAQSPVRKEQIVNTPDSVLRHRNPPQRGLTSNNVDRYAFRCQDSTDSLARNEDRKALRMHVDHSLNKTAKDGRPEELTLRGALRAGHVYPVRSGPKDVNMIANLVSKKRKIQEAGEHPALVNKPDRDAWTRPQIRSVIVAPPSWKKQKI